MSWKLIVASRIAGSNLRSCPHARRLQNRGVHWSPLQINRFILLRPSGLEWRWVDSDALLVFGERATTQEVMRRAGMWIEVRPVAVPAVRSVVH